MNYDTFAEQIEHAAQRIAVLLEQHHIPPAQAAPIWDALRADFAKLRSDNQPEPVQQPTHTETTQRTSEASYRLLVDHFPHGGVSLFDHDLRFLIVSGHNLRQLGYLRDEIEGYTIWEVLPPERWADVEALYRSILAGTAPAVLEWPHASGTFLLYPISIRDADGSIVAGMLIAEDITERKQMEERLRFKASALNAIGQAVIITDMSGSITYWNHAAEVIYGWNELEVLGRNIITLTPPSLHEQGKSYISLMQPGQRYAGETLMYRRDGTIIPVYAISTVLIDDHGQKVGIIGVSSDLTEQRRLQEERRKLDAQMIQTQKLESLGILAGGIAHDFNNLLTAMMGHASLALLDLPATSPARESIAHIELAAQRAAELSKQMLSYSGRASFAMQPIDLNRLVVEMGQLLQTVIAKTAMLTYMMADHLPPILADPTQLRQVVMNLITNASDAIGNRIGTITLTTTVVAANAAYLQLFMQFEPLPEGQYVSLEVSDTGMGMDAATQERIFDPFFTTKFTGRGLGLAAVQGIVRGHKAALHVESQIGQGTTFRVLFPISTSEQTAVVSKPTTPRQGAGRLVLVIDDDAEVRMLAQRVLERGGYRVVMAEDGLIGVRIFTEQHADLAAVLLDLTMPVMSGLETFNALQQIQPSIPILLCSGYSEEDATINFVGKGLAGFIQKPFRPTDLLAALHQKIVLDKNL
jgi:PAS domain S-box-containing protein